MKKYKVNKFNSGAIQSMIEQKTQPISTVFPEPPKTKPLERPPLLEINYYHHGQTIKIKT